MDPLVALRSSIAAKLALHLITTTDISTGDKTDDISQAQALVFPPIPGLSKEEVAIPLDTRTRFQIKDGDSKEAIDLRTIYNCWVTKDLNVTDYISISAERDVKNLKFLDRTDLITWLEGASSESENIVPLGKEGVGASLESATAGPTEGLSTATSAGAPALTTTATATAPSAKVGTISLGLPKQIDPHLEEILSHERVLVDYNKELHGSKAIDFSFAAKECKQHIIVPLKQAIKGKPVSASSSSSRYNAGNVPPSVQAASSHAAGRNLLPQKRGKDPIILVSPSASSLLNMANVKQFLEEGVFAPSTVSGGSSNIIRLSRKSSRLGNVRFVVVDSVDRFKPEYWDRVVAVFVTGQQWQLNPYLWSDPNVLFQKVLGFSVIYKGDPVPPALQHWNVAIETLDRNHRFRDREVVERVWDKIENYMISRGWSSKN